jgi:hypothetical protein
MHQNKKRRTAMCTEVRTRQELTTAIINNAAKIHVADVRLAAHLLARPKKQGFFSYAQLINGYRLICAKALGVFDVSLIKMT